MGNMPPPITRSVHGCIDDLPRSYSGCFVRTSTELVASMHSGAIPINQIKPCKAASLYTYAKYTNSVLKHTTRHQLSAGSHRQITTLS